MIKKITIIGATGMLGKPVVRELVKAGYEITAMVRQPDEAKKKLPGEVKLINGDLRNKEDIREALKDAEGVYLNLSTRPEIKKYDDFIPERDGVLHVSSVVDNLNRQFSSDEGLKIKRLGMISSLVHRYEGMNGFHWWVFEIKQWAAQYLRDASFPVTLFYPSTFMESFDQGGFMQGNRLMLAGKSRHPIFFISGKDYGRMVSEAFRAEDDNNHEYDIQGTEGLTLNEAAHLFLKNYQHGPLKITGIPMFLIKAMGLVNAEMHYISKIMDAMNHYPEPEPDEETWKKLGKPRITLSKYARKVKSLP